ncbi:unnamed protein product [Lampetra fluviatilis]
MPAATVLFAINLNDVLIFVVNVNGVPSIFRLRARRRRTVKDGAAETGGVGTVMAFTGAGKPLRGHRDPASRVHA